MAEVVGIIASGISIAQITGSLVTTALKIKDLLSEVKDVPDNIQFLLDQIDVLVPVLSQIDTNDDALPIPAVLGSCLQSAVLHCQKAVDQLEALCRELSTEVGRSRKLMRKVRSTRVLLRRNDFARYEKRVSDAMQHLVFVQQTCSLILQRFIVSQVMHKLRPTQEADLRTPSVISDYTQAEPLRAGGSPSRLVRTSSGSRSVMETVFEVHVQNTLGALAPDRRLCSDDSDFNQLGKNDNERVVQRTMSCSLTESVVFRLKLQTPSWLGSRVLQFTCLRSYAGWTHVLETYKVHQLHSREWKTVSKIIKRDDVSALRRLFDERTASPNDRGVNRVGDSSNISIISLALENRSWRVCNYLFDLGVEPVVFGAIYQIWGVRDDNSSSLVACLEQDDLPGWYRNFTLASYRGDPQDFLGVRRRIWADSDFYSDEFRNKRYCLFIDFVDFLEHQSFAGWEDQTPLMPDICRQVLSPGDHLRQGDLNFACEVDWKGGLLHGCAAIMSASVRMRADTGKAWRALVRDMLLLLPNYRLLHLRRPGTCGRTPFLRLFDYVLTHRLDHRLNERITLWNDTMASWLSLLQEVGVDLEEYGRAERQSFLDNYNGVGYNVYIESWEPRTIRLTGFQYGKQAEDWKLWWSEPTDEFAGEFWAWQESELNDFARMPGAWVEDGD